MLSGGASAGASHGEPSQYEQIHYGVTELGTDPVVNVSVFDLE